MAKPFGESPQAALQWIEGGDGLAKERLFVYRRNCLSSLIDCLKGRYPRIREALGGARFDALAQEFVLAHPPDDEVLIHYGVGFAELLGAGVAPWLADLALLELYWHQSYHERDLPPLAASALSEVPPEKLDSLAFECHPTVRSLASEWDLLVPWEDPLEKGPAPSLRPPRGSRRRCLEPLSARIRFSGLFQKSPRRCEHRARV